LAFKTIVSSMPLATSCYQETLRLCTSSFSIRMVEENFVLPIGKPASPGSSDAEVNKMGMAANGIFIPGGSRVVCITRAAHLTGDHWGGDPLLWDGARFLEKEGEGPGPKNKKAKEMRAFGGGVSICEGRYLAAAELKTLLALTLSKFDITPLYASAKDGSHNPATPEEVSKLRITGNDMKGISPKRAESRPGMGAFQYEGLDMMVRLKRRVEHHP